MSEEIYKINSEQISLPRIVTHHRGFKDNEDSIE